MDGEARLNIEKERGLVLKVDGERVVVGGGEELDTLSDFPFYKGKFDKAPAGKRPLAKGKLARRRLVG